MLNYLIGGGDIRSYIIQLLLCLPVVMLALSFHETAHGYIAYKLGDPTARNLGRLTMNPAKHLDILGFLCMLLFGFGWAKPVPINTRYFKKPKRDMVLTAIAGPISNVLMAFIFALAMKIFITVTGSFYAPTELIGYMKYLFYLFLRLGIRLNIGLAVFNLIPIPPLDGSRLITSFLPPKAAYWVIKHERIIYIVLLVALFVGVLDPILNFVTSGLMDLIYLIFGI